MCSLVLLLHSAASQSLSFLLNLIQYSAACSPLFMYNEQLVDIWGKCSCTISTVGLHLVYSCVISFDMDHGSFLGGIWSPFAQVWRMGRQRPSFCWWVHCYIQQSQGWEEGWEWTRYRIPLQRRQDWEGGSLCHQGKFSMSLHASGSTFYFCFTTWKYSASSYLLWSLHLLFSINLVIPLRRRSGFAAWRQVLHNLEEDKHRLKKNGCESMVV